MCRLQIMSFPIRLIRILIGLAVSFVTRNSDQHNHIKLSHIDTHKYKCDECVYTCSSRTSLKRHRAKHTDERNFSCIECGALFRTDWGRKNHEMTHLRAEDRKYKCDQCTKTFYASFKLKMHVKTHTGELAYSCSICGKGFIQKANLMTHIKKYHEE